MRRSRKLAALLLGMAAAAVVGPLLAGAPAAMATTTLEPREGRKECRSVPNCVTVKTPAQDLRAGKLVTREFSCPKGTYFWNWSATVAQFVQVSLQATRLDKKKHEVAATFEYYAQTGNGAGAAQVYLGCSPAPVAAGKLTQRRLSYGWNPHQ